MVTLYAIVWVAIGFAFFIYCLAFIKVWRHRHELTGLFNPFNEDPFGGTVTTDIEIVRTSMHPPPSGTYNPGQRSDSETGAPPIPGIEDPERPNAFDPYSVNVEVGPQDDSLTRYPSRPEVFRVRSLTRNHAMNETNPDAWLYARVAFLFFCALLISWVPSSINRLYSLIHPDRLNFGLNYTETLVLPLQGFWNACVYITASQTAVKNLFRSMARKPALPRRNDYLDSSRLDKASGDNGALTKGVNKGVGKVAAGLSKSGKDDGRMDRFASTRPTRRERERLGSDVSSVTSLTPAHHR